MLTNSDLIALSGFRHELHRHPEVSGEERETAARVVDFLSSTEPDRLLAGLGGHGVAAVYDSGREGPTVLIRCELDALPISERSGVPHASLVPGKAHMCGHDGHMTIVSALGRQLGRKRTAQGRVILLFQPAEETGTGAAAIVADPAFADIAPDWAFALHNLPGLPLGEARLKAGVVNCASRGMRITLDGRTAHASTPETGLSPVPAVGVLLGELMELGSSGDVDAEDFSMATITHVRIGEPTFGVAPGQAELRVTLRTRQDDAMAQLTASVEAMVAKVSEAHGLAAAIAYHDVFVASVNADQAVDQLQQALAAEGVRYCDEGLPMRASEDFGVFGHDTPSAMFFLGAGELHPALHSPDYDFPDALIAVGSKVFMRLIRNLLG